ncbi:hypothetical protein NNJEOMEG_01929 [Fundidesulfovibrio magnetotacticus]|uniref:DUF4881 domain-containing protein n=1 Tax=Fundidesulfovibrio magnetotacticus TaxID=2730080 RepID=A0A6V8LT06_9BACT|nr:DUF4881 domain-containing protein [Fundidesulfovibrio magnetotacticus]GFK94090.1 hypothetical protein NNJEOMEG_01929 [Fundidesulfovibrio magnetotacticus]
MKRISILLAALALASLVGCSDFGKVDQGRVVAYDKDAGKVTFIRDKKAEPLNPDYSGLPAVTYTIPTNPEEMGPAPKAGLRMKLDTQKSQIVIYDPKEQNFKTIGFKIHDMQENVERDHPLVFDKATGKAKVFPMVDKTKKTVTVYSARQKMLVTFSVPDEYMTWPDSTWDAGDEVRVYYKEDGKSLRFMNISKTDIFKK